MTKKIIKREAIVHITPDGKVVSVLTVKSDFYSNFPRGDFGGHFDNEPIQLPVMREPKEDRNIFPSR